MSLSSFRDGEDVDLVHGTAIGAAASLTVPATEDAESGTEQAVSATGDERTATSQLTSESFFSDEGDDAPAMDITNPLAGVLWPLLGFLLSGWSEAVWAVWVNGVQSGLRLNRTPSNEDVEISEVKVVVETAPAERDTQHEPSVRSDGEPSRLTSEVVSGGIDVRSEEEEQIQPPTSEGSDVRSTEEAVVQPPVSVTVDPVDEPTFPEKWSKKGKRTKKKRKKNARASRSSLDIPMEELTATERSATNELYDGNRNGDRLSWGSVSALEIADPPAVEGFNEFAINEEHDELREREEATRKRSCACCCIS